MILRPALLSLMLCLCLSPIAANAADPVPRWIAGSGLSLDAAVRQVKQQTGGRILSAETVTRDGKRYHRIKVLLPDGTVRIMILSAQ